MTTHTIPSNNLATLNDRIDRMNKAAIKLHLAQIVVTETAREVKPQMVNGKETGLFTEWVTVDVVGESPIINGWTFIAQLAHGEQGNIVRNLSGDPLPESYRTAPADCDHCHTNRARNETYILRNESSEYKQVGSSCLKDFTGHGDPHSIAAWLENLNALTSGLTEDTDDDMSDGYGGSHLIDSQNFLTHVSAIIRTYGWMGRTKAEINQTVSTCDKAISNMLTGFLVTRVTPTEEDYSLAKIALEWGKVLDGRSEYEWNLHLICQNNYCEPRNLGLLASLIVAYRKAHGQSETGSKTASEFIGSVGDKVTVEVDVTSIKEIEGQYGLTSVVNMRSGDNAITWFASGAAKVEQGQHYTLKGTVKKHEAYNGINTTYLTRCKVA